LYSLAFIGPVKTQCRAQAYEDERGWQPADFVQTGTHPMLNCCSTWIFFVDTPVRTFTFALCLVLSGVHNLFF